MKQPWDVAVVIPAYNGAWCIERAIASCQSQSVQLRAIHVVDDGSTDDTAGVVRRLRQTDPRIQYHALLRNTGHLQALREGLSHCAYDWVALLDADDELTARSIESRLLGAQTFQRQTGEWPGIVYGDLYRNASKLVKFKRIWGRDAAFLTRELSLCQTSTIMLSVEALPFFPTSTNPYNTDDEIVLVMSRHFAFAHCGEAVAIAHDSAGPLRMTNSAWRRFCGIRQLVRDHQYEILRDHGARRVMLWYLRILRSLLAWQAEGLLAERLSIYRSLIKATDSRLSRYLESHFDQVYF